jgi:DNA (cytosine-5)-methyltransferase 1
MPATPADLMAWQRLSRRNLTEVLKAIWTVAPAQRDLTGDITYHDWFCGGGGSSQGAESVPGVFIKAAANHWARAIETHERNFPEAVHKHGDIREMDLTRIPPCMIFWSSPECPYWSQGQGKTQTFSHQASLFDGDGPLPPEAAERSRALMWDVARYLDAMVTRGQPVLCGVVENVTDVCKWVHFGEWRRSIERLGYKTHLVALNSMHAQSQRTPRAPQSRDRFYLVYWHEKLGRNPDFDKWLRPTAWCPACEQNIKAVQVWRKPGTTMGRYHQQYDYLCPKVSCQGQRVEPYVLPAIAAIDWGDLGTRIGDRPRPLAPKTMARIMAGAQRHWLPILLAAAGNTYERTPGVRTWPVGRPAPTQMATSQHALACPPLIAPAGGTWNDTAMLATEPFRARTTRENDALVVPPFMVEMRDGNTGHSVADPMATLTTSGGHHGMACPPILLPLRSGRNRSIPVTDPTATIVADGSNHALAIPAPLLMRNNAGGAEMCTPVGEPMRTLTSAGHQSLLIPYYGTGVARTVGGPMGAVTSLQRFGMASQDWHKVIDERGNLIIDPSEILFRMLKVPEIHAAMAFGEDYIVLGNQREQIRQLGNAVTPPVAEVLISALVEVITNTQLELAA